MKRLWKQPVGGGYASFAVSGGLAFTIEQRRDREVVAAYDVATGRQKWVVDWAAHFSESMGGDGPRTTPVVDQGRVYALGAEGELRALDASTGKTVWNKNILADNGASNIQWAQAASPLPVGVLASPSLLGWSGTGGGNSVATSGVASAARTSAFNASPARSISAVTGCVLSGFAIIPGRGSTVVGA